MRSAVHSTFLWPPLGPASIERANVFPRRMIGPRALPKGAFAESVKSGQVADCRRSVTKQRRAYDEETTRGHRHSPSRGWFRIVEEEGSYGCEIRTIGHST